MTFDGLVANKEYRITYYNIYWDVLEVNQFKKPKYVNLHYIGRDTIVMSHHNSGVNQLYLKGVTTTYAKTEAVGAIGQVTVFSDLNPDSNYELSSWSLSMQPLEVLDIKTTSLSTPNASVLDENKMNGLGKLIIHMDLK